MENPSEQLKNKKKKNNERTNKMKKKTIYTQSAQIKQVTSIHVK